MQITAIEHMTKHKMRVFLDGEPAFVLTDRELYELDIREGDELNEEQENLLLQKVGRMAVRTAMDLLVRRDHSEAELYKKLRDKGFSEELAARGMAYVQSYHYLDDERYARQLILSKRGTLSRKMMAYKMKQKGLSDNVIREMLDEAEWDDTEGIHYEIRRKYNSVQSLLRRADKDVEKFCQSLIRKGYNYGDIRSVLRDMSDGDGDEL